MDLVGSHVDAFVGKDLCKLAEQLLDQRIGVLVSKAKIPRAEIRLLVRLTTKLRPPLHNGTRVRGKIDLGDDVNAEKRAKSDRFLQFLKGIRTARDHGKIREHAGAVGKAPMIGKVQMQL